MLSEIQGFQVSKLEIKKNKEEVKVEISVLPFEEIKKEVRISSKEVLQHLIGIGYKELVIDQSSVINNLNPDSLSGIWIFKKDSIKELISLTEELGGYEKEFLTEEEVPTKKSKKKKLESVE